MTEEDRSEWIERLAKDLERMRSQNPSKLTVAKLDLIHYELGNLVYFEKMKTEGHEKPK